MSHSHGIHCIHICGFDFARWCSQCRRSFDEFVAGASVFGPIQTAEDQQAVLDLYRKYVDISLSTVVTSEIERGELPAPVGFPAPEALSEKLRVIAEPSAN